MVLSRPSWLPIPFVFNVNFSLDMSNLVDLGLHSHAQGGGSLLAEAPCLAASMCENQVRNRRKVSGCAVFSQLQYWTAGGLACMWGWQRAGEEGGGGRERTGLSRASWPPYLPQEICWWLLGEQRHLSGTEERSRFFQAGPSCPVVNGARTMRSCPSPVSPSHATHLRLCTYKAFPKMITVLSLAL